MAQPMAPKATDRSLRSQRKVARLIRECRGTMSENAFSLAVHIGRHRLRALEEASVSPTLAELAAMTRAFGFDMHAAAALYPPPTPARRKAA